MGEILNKEFIDGPLLQELLEGRITRPEFEAKNAKLAAETLGKALFFEILRAAEDPKISAFVLPLQRPKLLALLRFLELRSDYARDRIAEAIDLMVCPSLPDTKY